MCAVIGIVLSQPLPEDLSIVVKVFRESRVRGLHATGMSFVKHGKVHTVKQPVGALDFLSQNLTDLSDILNEDGNLYLIGHCRYSTSDLEFNQPISNSSVSVVHNGVISQEPAGRWKDLYGYECQTQNDTELLLQSIFEQRSPLDHWRDASIAAVELHSSRKIRFYRNGKRPIYLSKVRNGFVITSTRDIARRAGIPDTKEVPMNTYVEVGADLQVHSKSAETNCLDLQNKHGGRLEV